jgi:two-component system cell cycle sensor histidine kinase/response regulator CckA
MRNKIVLADDESAVRSYVKSILRRDGFEVFEAEDGLEALGMIRQLEGDVDLLVTDVRMPRMDGPTLAESVIREYPDISILFISGYWLDVNQENRKYHDKTCGYVRKPFLPKALLEAVTHCLGPKKAVSSA